MKKKNWGIKVYIDHQNAQKFNKKIPNCNRPFGIETMNSNLPRPQNYKSTFKLEKIVKYQRY